MVVLAKASFGYFLCFRCICYFVSLLLIVTNGAVDCLERLVFEMTCCILRYSASSWHLTLTKSGKSTLSVPTFFSNCDKNVSTKAFSAILYNPSF